MRARLDNVADPALGELARVRQPQTVAADGNDAAGVMGQLICDNPGEFTLVAIGR